MYTLDYDLAQLDRMYTMIDHGQPIRIIHLMYNDENTLEDRYIVLVHCDPKLYTLLCLI